MRTGELLFRTLVLRGDTHSGLPGQWKSATIEGLAALMDYERGALWLQRRLREAGAEQAVPPVLAQALRERTRDTAARNLLVDAEAARVIARLQALGVPCVLIKGIARRAAAALYPCADARATNDVDVIVPEADAQRAWQDLVNAGYRRISEATSPHHLPPLVGEGRVGVELHTSLAHTLPPAEAWRRATAGGQQLQWNGSAVRVPSATELLWHGLTHAVREGPDAFRLRYLLDGAAILAGAAPIDWAVVQDRLREERAFDAGLARSWLGAAGQLAGSGIPAELASGAPHFDVPRAMAWRLAVLARRPDAGLGARLLEEGTRVELALPAAAAVLTTSPIVQTRRRLGSRAARVMYWWWRARAGRAMPG